MSTETQDIEIIENHTPGPWERGVTTSHERRVAQVLKGTDMIGGHNTLCDIFAAHHPIEDQEPVANAKLIAQAPQLQAKVVEQQQTIEALRDERDALREKGRAMIDAIDHFARETNETWTSVDVAEKIVAAYKGLSEALMQCEHRELLAKASAQAIDVRQQD